MRIHWIKPLAKSAGRSDAGIYYILRKRFGRQPPYSEYETLTLLRSLGIACKGYRPIADAVGKPLPPLLKKGEQPPPGPVSAGKPKRLLPRLASLLPGGANAKNKNRVRYYMKHAGFGDMSKMEEAQALEVMERRGISIKGFEYEKPPGTPGSAKLVPDAADTYELLLEQYNEVVGRLQEANAAMDQRDVKIASLIRSKGAARGVLLQFQNRHPQLVAKVPEELQAFLNYPLIALQMLLQD